MPLLLPEGHCLLQKQPLADQRLLQGPQTHWQRHQTQHLGLCPCRWETLAHLQEVRKGAGWPSAADTEGCLRWALQHATVLHA